jgi:uncharacterized repeat protein (TIGR04138 family)
MRQPHELVAEIVKRDPRYDFEAYEFLRRALRFTQERLGLVPPGPITEDNPKFHVTGRQLLEGMRDLAHRDFGRMARVVFRNWGINQTEDVGNMVFNLVEAGLLFRRPEDTLDDFRHVFDMDEALIRDYEFRMEDSE